MAVDKKIRRRVRAPESYGSSLMPNLAPNTAPTQAPGVQTFYRPPRLNQKEESKPKKQTYRIPVSNGLLEHCLKMGDAIWLFLWLIDRTTKEDHDKGKVLGGMPVRDRDIADSLGGISTKSVRRWRAALAGGHYVEAKNTGHGYSYQVLKSKKKYLGADTNVPSDKNVHSESGQKCPDRITQTGNSELPKRATLYRQYKDTTEKQTPPSVALPDWLPQENWNAFVEVRKKMRAVLTPRAVTLLIRQLEKLRSQGQDPAAVLDQSVMNGWKGVFPLRGTPANGNTAPAGGLTKSVVEEARLELARRGYTEPCNEWLKVRERLRLFYLQDPDQWNGWVQFIWPGAANQNGELVILVPKKLQAKVCTWDVMEAIKYEGLRYSSVKVEEL